MNILLNGKELELPAGTTIKQLIEQEGMTGKRLAVEVNREIIPKTEHELHKLNDQDAIEIVHAIGGG